MTFRRHQRELPPALALAALLGTVAVVAPSFFSSMNLRDLALNEAPVLLVAIGVTLVILAGEIDISVGSQFAVCSVAAGWFAKAGTPMVLMPACLLLTGAAMGALNGWLVGVLRLPSIIVTLAMLVAWRDALRWVTDGAWVQDLPVNFQWFGLGHGTAQWVIVLAVLTVLGAGGWALRNLAAGRAVYAVGSDAEAARLAGIEPPLVIFSVFVATGALTGLAALLNAVRFSAVPANAGIGLEMKAIAAVVVGGTLITGGRGNLSGTLVGVALLGTIGTALSFVGINPFWEKAIQGAIILVAIVSDATIAGLQRRVRLFRRARVVAR